MSSRSILCSTVYGFAQAFANLATYYYVVCFLSTAGEAEREFSEDDGWKIFTLADLVTIK